jgi:hypothetical protein
MPGRCLTFLMVWSFGSASIGMCVPNPSQWVPARWDGGPLELARRAKDNTLNAGAREAIAKWYDPATLNLLKGTPINALLVTFSIGAASDAEARQQQLVGTYARMARERGLAVLGVVHPGADSLAVAAGAVESQLDGLVLDGEFPAGFAAKVESALRARNSAAPVVQIWRDVASARAAHVSLFAVEGVRPSARNLADLGIRAGPSAEPWIESNIWLVKSLRLGPEWRPIWINQQPNPGLLGDYVRCVADAAVAGGRWIVAPDDDLRSRLFRMEAGALGTWRNIATYLKFAEDHAGWRSFLPYGNVGIIADADGKDPEVSNEYLNLVTRRQVPYRLIARPALSQESLVSFRAVLAPDLAAPTRAERILLNDFADKGGLVVAGPWWGSAPKNDPFVEIQIGKGRAVVYKDEPPEPESVSKDLVELLEPDVVGLSVFNVPSVISYVSTREKQALIQVLNYATLPSNRVTIRFNGNFNTARFYTPEYAPINLPVHAAGNNHTELLIPQLATWGAVLLE